MSFKDKVTSDLHLEADLVLTSVKNKITSVNGGTEFFDSGFSAGMGNLTRNQPGHAPSEFFGYQVQGLFQSTAEVTASAIQSGAEPGFFRYSDINNSGVIDFNDRTFIGNPNPRFTYGLNVSVDYKNFNFTVFFVGSKGNDILNYTKWWTDFWPYQGGKNKDLLNKSWTPDRPSESIPKASFKSNFSTSSQPSTYYIEDGSFTRLKNLQIGYSIPKSAINKVGLKNARLYLQGVNLLTFTKYSGLDPEIGGNDSAFGIDFGKYPITKQYCIGVIIGI